MSYLLGIDQGSGGSRAPMLDPQRQVRGYGYRPLASIPPHPGWVVFDPARMARGGVQAAAEAAEHAGCQRMLAVLRP